MECLRLDSHSPEQTRLLGNDLGGLAGKGDVLLLVGELGTGKTCLVQGIAHGLAVREYAFSPSFVIVREYRGRLPLYHIDLYRLDRIEEIADLGLEEYLSGDGVSVVEWADKGMQLMPDENLLVSLQYVPASDTSRSIYLAAQGRRYRELTEELAVRAGIRPQTQNARVDRCS